MPKLARATLIAALLALGPTAIAVSAHEVPTVEVDCPAHEATASGIKFGGEGLPMTITVTGPAGFAASFTVTTDEWTATFPIGDNGSYLMTWPNAGQFERHFEVDCAEPTPTPSASATPRDPTPTPPLRTPPPTSTTSDVPSNDRLGDAFVALVLIFAAVMVRLALAPRSHRRYR